MSALGKWGDAGDVQVQKQSLPLMLTEGSDG